MAAMLKPSAEYNRRITTKAFALGAQQRKYFDSLDTWDQFIYVVAKYTAQNNSKFEGSSMPARKSHSKKRITRTPAVVERTQALILDEPGQSLRVLIDEAVDGNCDVRKAIYFSAGWCTGSYESFDSKLALRQRRFCPRNSGFPTEI